MKYCPKCKLRMPAEAAACKQCGGPLRTVGVPSADDLGGTPAEADLTMQLQGMQHAVRRSRLALYVAGGLALVLTALFVLLLAGWHFYEVRQYADVAELDVRLRAGSPSEAEIRFVRRNSGKVEFVRETAGRTETLIDHGFHDFAAMSPEKRFAWSGGGSDEFKIRVRVRDGWRTREELWIAKGGTIHKAN